MDPLIQRRQDFLRHGVTEYRKQWMNHTLFWFNQPVFFQPPMWCTLSAYRLPVGWEWLQETLPCNTIQRDRTCMSAAAGPRLRFPPPPFLTLFRRAISRRDHLLRSVEFTRARFLVRMDDTEICKYIYHEVASIRSELVKQKQCTRMQTTSMQVHATFATFAKIQRATAGKITGL